MKKKIIATIVSSALLIMSLSGCGSKSQAKEPDLLDEIKARGYITVGTEGIWSPYTYHDENDNLVGFDVEVAKYIAD